MSQDEIKRLLAMAANIKVRAMLSLAYGCGLRAGVVRLRVGDIDSAQRVACCHACGRLRYRDEGQALEHLRKTLHGPDWRGYAQILERGSWPRANFYRSDTEMMAICREGADHSA